MELTVNHLRLVKQDLEEMTDQSPDLEERIISSKLLVRHLFPEESEEFELIAIEPSKTTSNFVWPGGSREAFEIFTRQAVEEQGKRIDQMRLQVIQRLSELLGE